MTVFEMLSRISARELVEWAEFYRLEPWGSEANFMGHAITAATVSNVNRRKGQRARSVEEFMPKFEADNQQNPKALFETIKNNLLRTRDSDPKRRKGEGK